LIKGLICLIKERFNPGSYLPMILFFNLGLGFYLLDKSGNSFSLEKFLISFIIQLSFFFRLRLFDEIKDYAFDTKFNPTRPLARGALTIDQTKMALLVLIAFELLVSGTLGRSYFFVHLVAVFYSLLMFEEFFIGSLLRPHLTTYGIVHTFVSCFSGFSGAYMFSRIDLNQVSLDVVLFFLTPWFYFNLFEFARKIFSQVEERPMVASYSGIFGIRWAWALAMSQVLLGLIFLNYLQIRNINYFLILSLIYFLVSLMYVFSGSIFSAKLFRNSTGLFLVGHFMLLTASYWS
jgi:hypothetical protein